MNKRIWTYWHQGFDNAPFLVNRCVEEWEKTHPNWELIKLDSSNIHDYVTPLPIDRAIQDKMKLAHRSDLIRTQLLLKYGGVWADPTTFPIQRLDAWLLPNMQAGFFMFQKPGRDRIIANWFIASEPEHPILNKVYIELCEYWNSNTFRNIGKSNLSRIEILLYKILNRNLNSVLFWFNPIMTKLFRIAPYMIYHYKVYHLIKNSNHLNTLFAKMPIKSANGPHSLKRLGLLDPINPKALNLIDQKKEPLFKLDWKIAQAGIPEGSVLEYLFDK